MRLGIDAGPTFAIICGLLIAAPWGAAQQIVVVPSVIQFTANADSPVVAVAQGIGVDVIGGGNVAYKYLGVFTGTNMPNFVVVSPSSGTTPTGVWVALNPNVVPYLIPLNYALTLQFGTPNQTSPPYGTAIVRLNLIAPPPPTITAAVSAATLQLTISPGEVLSIFGTHLSTPPVTAQFDSAGLYPTSLGNTTVTFNGVPAPLLYVSTTQINAQVPYEVTGQKNVNVVVTHNAAPSPPFSVPVLDTSPGLFTVTQNGNGQGAILNTDVRNPNIVSFNSVDNPAPKGSAIVIYATGSGLWNRTVQDGSILLDTLTLPTAPVSLTIGGQPARILYAGAAPFLVSGMLQVNATVPDGIGSGLQPLLLTIGQNSNTQQRVTVAIQ